MTISMLHIMRNIEFHLKFKKKLRLNEGVNFRWPRIYTAAFPSGPIYSYAAVNIAEPNVNKLL